jgi:hypothetical protein
VHTVGGWLGCEGCCPWIWLGRNPLVWPTRPVTPSQQAARPATSLGPLLTTSRRTPALRHPTRQVEVLSRVMRKWDDDGVPDEEASNLGEFIYKVGMGVEGVGVVVGVG